MQILHLLFQKSEDKRVQGNLKEFSLTELIMTEKKTRKNCTFCFTKNKLCPKILRSISQPLYSLSAASDIKHPTKYYTSSRNPEQKQMPRKISKKEKAKCSDKSCVKEEESHS